MKVYKIFTVLVISMTLLTGCRETKSKDVIDMGEYQLEDRIEFYDPIEYIKTVDTILTNEQKMYLEMFNKDTDVSDEYSKGKKTKYYVFHCTASKEGVDLGLQWFLDFFENERKWSRPGYTELLTLDGQWKEMRVNNYDGYTSYQEMTYGVRGINSESMHFAYVGGVDKNLKPKNTLTAGQEMAIRDKILQIKCFDPEAEIIFGHRDVPGVTKACPSFDVREKFKGVI